jgi:hypothetical protein
VRHRERGSILLVTLIIALALLALGIGVLGFGQHERAGGDSLRRREQLASCALAVRQYLGSQLRFPSAPRVTNLDFTIPGGTTSIRLQGGHYGAVSVSSFALNGTGGVYTRAQELSNNIAGASGSTTLTGGATCTDADGNQYEVEFTFGFGLY